MTDITLRGPRGARIPAIIENDVMAALEQFKGHKISPALLAAVRSEIIYLVQKKTTVEWDVTVEMDPMRDQVHVTMRPPYEFTQTTELDVVAEFNPAHPSDATITRVAEKDWAW